IESLTIVPARAWAWDCRSRDGSWRRRAARFGSRAPSQAEERRRSFCFPSRLPSPNLPTPMSVKKSAGHRGRRRVDRPATIPVGIVSADDSVRAGMPMRGRAVAAVLLAASWSGPAVAPADTGTVVLYNDRVVALKQVGVDPDHTPDALWVRKADLPRINDFEL